MNPRLVKLGQTGSPLVIIDAFSGEPGGILDLAAELAPFPPDRSSHYPGLRRPITAADQGAFAYVERTLEAAAPFIGGAFDVDSFDLLEASFSMVTVPPDRLKPAQRAPHFDSVDANYLAVLHYLSATPGSGTAFFRHRSTAIETVSPQNVDQFVSAARGESAAMPDRVGYIQGSNRHFEQIGSADGVLDRLVIYRGALLHSGIIPRDMSFAEDPRRGRLTANIFVQAR